MNHLPFYSIIEIHPCRTTNRKLAGMRGIILTMAPDTGNGVTYGVYVHALDESWVLYETEVEATGLLGEEPDIYDGSSIRIRVDPITGEGSIVDDED